MDNSFFVILLSTLVPYLSLADPPDPEKYLIRGDVLSVRLGGFETDEVWPHRAQGLVLISDRHNNTVRLCSDGLTDAEVLRLCYSLGYSGGRAVTLGSSYPEYGSLHTIRQMSCGGKTALEQCYRHTHDFSCFLEKFKHVELYCTNTWYGPGVPCGTDIGGVVTAAEDNPLSSDDPVAVEVGELIGATSRMLPQEPVAQERIVQPTNILSAVQFPWTAKVMFYENVQKKWVYKCGAAILTDRVVLTLASCVSGIGYYAVVFGDFDTEVKNRFVEWFSVSNTAFHPNFNGDGVNNDIAILILKDKRGLGLQFRPTAFPVCLPTSNAPLSGNRNAVVAGWGKQVSPNSATLSRFLTIAKVKLYDRSDCPGHEDSNSGIICAGNPEGGSDACNQDFGAPLIAKIKSRSLLVGLLKEPGCGESGKPSKYVSIQHHLDWIKSTVSEVHAQINAANQSGDDDDDEDSEEVDIWAEDEEK